VGIHDAYILLFKGVDAHFYRYDAYILLFKHYFKIVIHSKTIVATHYTFTH